GGPLEARCCLSTLGGHGALPIWRSALHLLSAVLVDTGSTVWPASAVEAGASGLYMDGFDAVRKLDVHAGAALVGAIERNLGGGVLRRESVSSGGCVLAKRLCRIAGGGMASPSPAAGVETRRRRGARHRSPERRAGGGLAYE